MSENDVKRAIIEYLTYTGWLVLRVNSGAVGGEHSGKSRFIRFVTWFVLGSEIQTAGVSDILALHPHYPPLAVETKAPGKLANVSAAQKAFLAAWAEHGGIWCVCESIDDLINALALDSRQMRI